VKNYTIKIVNGREYFFEMKFRDERVQIALPTTEVGEYKGYNSSK
jgi:hypothetical protein